MIPAYGYAPNGYGVSTTGIPNTNVYVPQINQPVQQQQQPLSSLMTIFVNTEEEVVNYPVAAGLTVLLISFNLKKFWLKSTNTNGVPQPLRVFPFTEEVQANTITNNQNDGVTREEFRALSEKLDRLLQDLGGGSK